MKKAGLESLLKEHTRIGRLGFLSRWATFATLLVGVLLLVTRNRVGLILGVVLISLALYFLVFVKDHTVLMVCTEGIILVQDQEVGVFLSFDEIEEFDFSESNAGELYFLTKNKERYTVTTFDRLGTAKLLNKPLQGKSHKDHVAQRYHIQKK